MPVFQVIASRPLAGTTAIAAGLAQGLAAGGARVRLVRLGSGAAADFDAATFATYIFASATGRPEPTVSAAAGETIVVEADAGAPLTDAAGVLVVRGAMADGDVSLGQSLGERLIGSIGTNVSPANVEAVARDLTNAGLRPLAIIPEDRVLAAPCVMEIRETLGASVLYEGENDLEVVEDVLIAPVYADPARPHFRRFASKAVLAPFNKTDLHLVAIETQAACLVITGGGQPSPYVVDRAQGEATTVLLSREETPATLASLSDVWLTSRFRGGRKAAAVYEHLNGRIDFANLTRRIESY
jgi:hypothetical protein